MPLPTQLASDADREAVADRLPAAAGEGRLDPDELEQRVAAAYAARTVDFGASRHRRFEAEP